MKLHPGWLLIGMVAQGKDREEAVVVVSPEAQAGAPATPLGLPLRLGRRRFFNFAIGYEIRTEGRKYDIYIDPKTDLEGRSQNEAPALAPP